MRHYHSIIAVALLSAILPVVTSAQSTEESFPVTGADGFELDGRLALPSGGDVDKVIVLLHGSGPQSMDVDLSTITRDGKENLYFRDLSVALSSAGFAVVRYNKRSYEARIRLQSDSTFQESAAFQEFGENPLKYFVDDALAAVGHVRDRFPEAGIYLLGHSQGAYVALQALHQGADVAGLALIGFALSSTDVLLLEQTVYRPMALFHDLDTDGSGVLDREELSAPTPIAASLAMQMGVIDLDADTSLSMVELQAGNMSNLVLRDMAGILRKQEAAYPRPAEILAAAEIDIAFFQGLWDNQTPAYNAKAVELVARHVWRKENFHFSYFQGLGHALDARTRYDDVQYDTIDPDAKATLIRELTALWGIE